VYFAAGLVPRFVAAILNFAMSEKRKMDGPPAASEHGDACSRGACWRLPLLLAVVLAAVVIVNGRGIRRATPGGGASVQPPAIQSARQTVALTVDFGDGRRLTWNAIPWQDGMTVDAALAHAAAHPGAETSDLDLSYIQHGVGASAFLSELGGVANEGAGGRNWTYRVNGQRADRSFAVYVLQPGDQVLWTFGGSR
jgi:hypothetical protein